MCQAPQGDQPDAAHSRRSLLHGAGAAALLAVLTPPVQRAQALPASKGKAPDVGSYLPSAGDGFVRFVPDEKKTPVLGPPHSE